MTEALLLLGTIASSFFAGGVMCFWADPESGPAAKRNAMFVTRVLLILAFALAVVVCVL